MVSVAKYIFKKRWVDYIRKTKKIMVNNMKLEDVKEQAQFEGYYESNGLNTPEEKINRLRKEMKITAICGEDGTTPDNVLPTLEHAALLGYWRAFV